MSPAYQSFHRSNTSPQSWHARVWTPFFCLVCLTGNFLCTTFSRHKRQVLFTLNPLTGLWLQHGGAGNNPERFLVHVPMTASHSYCGFGGCTSMLQSSGCSTFWSLQRPWDWSEVFAVFKKPLKHNTIGAVRPQTRLCLVASVPLLLVWFSAAPKTSTDLFLVIFLVRSGLMTSDPWLQWGIFHHTTATQLLAGCFLFLGPYPLWTLEMAAMWSKSQ